MPIFQVRRILGHASKDDVDAAAFRAIVCAYEYPGMKWHESYWDAEREEMICIYEADDADQIFIHAERSRIACDEVREVTVIRPGDYVPALPPPPASISLG